MKKLTAFMLSALIIITPLYSYAVLPIIATAASSAGRVLVGNAVKKPVGTAVRRGALPCLGGNPSFVQCLGIGLGIAQLLDDKGYTVEEGDTINNNINIEIYKIEDESPSLCTNTFAFANGSVSHAPMNSFYNSMLSWANSKSLTSSYVPAPNWQSPFYEALNRYKSMPDGVVVEKWTKLTDFIMQVKNSDSDQITNYYANLYYRCIGNESQSVKNYISQSELNTIIDQSINNLSLNQRKQFYKNIYNYDFSQHPNITINNNSTSGNTINNDIKNAPKEFEVSVELGDKINNGQQDMDDINDKNCDKNDQGQYDKCGDDRNEPEPEPEPEPEKPEPPIECGANGFYQKICDWMDWTQGLHEPDLDTTIEVTDKTSDIVIDSNRISFDNQCPTPKPIDITVVGYSFSEHLDYQPLCDFFIKLKPFVVGIGGVSSALIIAGGARRG